MMQNNSNQPLNEGKNECEESTFSEFDYDTEIEEMKYRWKDISSRTEFMDCDESVTTVTSSLSELTNSLYTTKSRGTESIFSYDEKSESDYSDECSPQMHVLKSLEGSTNETGTTLTIAYDQEAVNTHVSSLTGGYQPLSSGSSQKIIKLQQKEIEILQMECDSSLEENINFDRYKHFCDDSFIQVGLKLEESGNLYEAKERYLNTLLTQKKIKNSCSRLNLDLIMSYRRLASINYKLKEWELAVTYYKEAIRVFEQYEKEVNENVCACEAYVKTLTDLGGLYSCSKKLKQAVFLHEKAFEVLQKNNNEAHHDIYPEICYQLGIMYKDVNKHYEAYMCHFKLSIFLRENRDTRKKKTPDKREPLNLIEKKSDKEKIEILNKICVLFAEKNEFREALYCCDDAFVIYASISKASIEDIILTHINKGNVLNALDRVGDAIASFSKALFLSKKLDEVTSTNDKSRCEVFYNIGVSYWKQGSLKDADQYFKKFLKSLKIISFSDDEKLSILLKQTNAFNNLGNIRYQMRNYKDAITFYQESLKLTSVIYGENSKETFETKCNLGTAYFDAKNFDLANTIFKQLLSSVEKSPVKDVDKALLLNKLGNVHMARKEFKDALINYKKSLMIKKGIFEDKNHSDILITVHNIALALFKEGKYDEAIAILLDVRKRYRAKIGEFDPLIGKINIDIANAFLHTGQINEAERDCLSAIKALNLAQVPENHPYIQYSRKMMRKIISRRNDLPNKEGMNRSLSKNHVFTQTCK